MAKRKGAPKLCTSVVADSPGEMAKKAKAAFSLGSDLVEFRIDRLTGGEAMSVLESELSVFSRRAIITVRSSREGGGFMGSESHRLDLISRLAGMKPAFLDIELDTARENKDWVKLLPKAVKRIVSWHDFKDTPALKELRSICREELGFGSLAKVVTTARSAEDNLTTLALSEERPGRVISFCMGELGTVSRVVAMRTGTPLVYASMPNEAVAPGQLSVSTMKQLRRMVA